MLVEFTIANFRSIGGRQRLSMVAGTSSKRDSRFSFKSGNRSAPDLLRTAALFGANGSGKSSVVNALVFADEFIRNSAKNLQEGELIQVVPFKFDDALVNSPSEFEIVFIVNGNQYQYGFSVDTQRVHDEWMFFTPAGPNQKTTRWFERRWDQEAKEYDWYMSPSIKVGARGQKDLWRLSTRDNALFFSTAIQLNAEQFGEAFSWFEDNLLILGAGDRLIPRLTYQLCADSENKAKVIGFLQAADLRICDIKFEETPMEAGSTPASTQHDDLRKMLRRLSMPKILIGHQIGDKDPVYLNLDEESDGTRLLFALSGQLLDTLENGGVLVVDELSNNLHPIMVGMIVELFNSPENNPNPAQLVFTGHETFVMDPRRMHRDQLHILQKDAGESTRIVPMSDYHPRVDEMFERGYLHGRYGGVPIPKPQQVAPVEQAEH